MKMLCEYYKKSEFEHDCDECKFIISLLIGSKILDFYVHYNSAGHYMEKSYIIRYSNEPSDNQTLFAGGPGWKLCGYLEKEYLKP